jgi:hypothetical protein
MSQHNKKNNKLSKRKNWPIILLAGGGALLLIGAFFAFVKPSQINAARDDSGTPRLEVDQELVDFGDVKVDRLVEATFRLTNSGEGTLRFTDAPYIEVLEGC